MEEFETILVNEVRAEDMTIVDVRKKPDDRQIPGSIRYDGEALANAEHPPFRRGERVVVYCGSGSSSRGIATRLREHGIDAVAIEGGYAAWKDAGFPTDPITEKRAI